MKHIIYFAAALIMVGCASNQKTTLSGLDKNDFDTIVNNQKISLFTLHNGDMEVCVTNLSLIHISEPTRRRGISDAVFCV